MRQSTISTVEITPSQTPTCHRLQLRPFVTNIPILSAIPNQDRCPTLPTRSGRQVGSGLSDPGGIAEERAACGRYSSPQHSCGKEACLPQSQTFYGIVRAVRSVPLMRLASERPRPTCATFTTLLFLMCHHYQPLSLNRMSRWMMASCKGMRLRPLRLQQSPVPHC